MRTASRLIRQIREALASAGANAPVETLAAEYAGFVREAGQRLESCAEMIERGSVYQAWQLGETEPALIDLLATLRFGGAREWDAFLAARQLPVAPRFDPKAIQALDGLYARGVELSDPLGKDYRAAVSSHDYAKALQITQSKLQLNPGDADAQAELVRLQNKLFQTKLQDLRGALSRHEDVAIVRELAALERLAPEAKLAACPERAEAAEIRCRVERDAASVLAGTLAATLTGERQAGAWRTVGDVLARIATLQMEHGFQLEAKAAALCAEMQGYFDAQRVAAEEAARFHHALNEAGELAEQIDTQLLTGSSLSLTEARNLYHELHRRWKTLEGLKGAVPEDLARRIDTTGTTLRTEIARLQRQRDFKVAASVVASLTVVLTAAWFAHLSWAAQVDARRLAALRESGEVEAAEKEMAALRKEHPKRVARPVLRARLDEMEGWVRDARQRHAEAAALLGELNTVVAGGFQAADPVALATQFATAATLTASLPAGLRTNVESGLAVAKNQFEGWLAQVREGLVKQTEVELVRLEKLAVEKLGYDQQTDGIAGALQTMQAPLQVLEARAHPSLPALELPVGQPERVAALRKRYDDFDKELAALQRINTVLRGARTLDTYLQALAGFKELHLSQATEVSEARRLLAGCPKPEEMPEEIMAGMLMPGDALAWAAVKEDSSGETFAPPTVLSEIDQLRALHSNEYLNDIWAIMLSDSKGQRPAWSRGKVEQDGPRTIGEATETTWQGSIYDPLLQKEIPTFVERSLSVKQSRNGRSSTGEISSAKRSAVSDCFARLELDRMVDATGAKFEKPLLRVFDDLVADRGADPVFKAFMLQQLEALMNARPYTWGLHYCPALRRDLATLKQWCPETLHAEDWLLKRKRDQFAPKLTPFFTELWDRRYLAGARKYRKAVRAVLETKPGFAGFLDGGRHPRLLGAAPQGAPLFALTTADTRVARFHPPDGAGPADLKFAAFSPIFFVPVDREALTRDVGGLETGVSAGSGWPPEAPFFEP